MSRNTSYVLLALIAGIVIIFIIMGSRSSTSESTIIPTETVVESPTEEPEPTDEETDEDDTDVMEKETIIIEKEVTSTPSQKASPTP